MDKVWVLLMVDRDTREKEVEAVKSFTSKPSAEDLLDLIAKHSAIDLSNNLEQLSLLENMINSGNNYVLFSDVYTLKEVNATT